MEKTVQKINIDKILLNPNQPRTHFNEQQIIELANSIKENGLIQPIVVRKTQDGFELVAGERRLRACQYLRLMEIDAIVQNYSIQQSAQIAIIENIQRENLSPIEEALAYEKLLSLYQMSQVELAQSLGKSQSMLANKIRLLKLQPEIKEAINNKDITERHGRALLKIKDDSKQLKAFNRIKEQQLNVARTEDLINKMIEVKEDKHKSKKMILNKKDYRLELNTIKQSLNVIEKSGVDVTIDTQELEEGFEIKIILKK